MVTSQDIDKIKEMPKRMQGPELDGALDSLMANGRTKGEAAAELAQALGTGVRWQSLVVAYNRRRGEPKRVVRVSSDTGAQIAPPIEASAPKRRGRPPKARDIDNGAAAKSSARWAEFERLLNAMVEERVEARLAEVRKALG